MKFAKLFALLVCVFLFSQCKSTSPTDSGTSSAPLLEIGRTLDAVETQLLQYADSTGGNASAALVRTAAWLKTQPQIQSVSVLDSSYLYVTLASGLTGVYYLDELDDAGLSIRRGGKNGGGELHHWDALSMRKITNKSVLLFSPVFEEFYEPGEFQSVLNKFSSSGLGLTVTDIRDSACTTDVVDHFGDYGLVILDTHGMPNGFLTGIQVVDTLSAQLEHSELVGKVNIGTVGYDKFAAGLIMLGRGLSFKGTTPNWQHQRPQVWHYPFKILLTSKYVQGLPKMPGTVVFGNMCYSGQSQPIPEGQGVPTPIEVAFSSLNPISYYGYAYAGGFASSVSNIFAKQMEDSLLRKLLTNTDSTGHCHLQQSGTEYYDVAGLEAELSKEKLFLKHFGADDYSYASQCVDSFVDARDGHLYHAVCIGTQNWMAENLAYDAPGSDCYDSSAANCAIYGRLYDRALVMNGAANSNANPSGVQGLCPKGWHIPSAAEWNQLIDFLGGSAIAGGKLKSKLVWAAPNVGASNVGGFSALGGGEWVYSNFALTKRNRNFYSLGSNGFFHTASEIHPGQVDVMTVYQGSVAAQWTTYPAVTLPVTAGNVSCRCLKD